ncbi:MAG: opacity protein [Sphingomonas bacterium]|uniref:opacity protein n=1 Tax=Sphingomonas bacterium TaxID=1895847 RepID=UPI00260B59CD|nr:opacity protein [Sphingomonas bacterium]MDB5703070.1 opacity protein [Sphingomonas bacterium]
MRKLFIVTAAAAALTAIPAFAQDASPDSGSDNARPSRIEPYVGVMGGWEQFDNERDAGIPQSANHRDRLDGSLVQGVAGVNVGVVGPLFVGAEGNAAKGVKGDIDWEYGAAGRVGVRAGSTGLFYGKVGYQWVNFDRFGDNSRDYHAMTYGAGLEVGTKSMAKGGIRLRGEVNTFGNAHSVRPMAGLVKAF